MLHTLTLRPLPSKVTVRFGDGAHSFPLRGGATLIDLADCIGVLGAHHDGAPISIDIEFNTPHSRPIVHVQPRHPFTH